MPGRRLGVRRDSQGPGGSLSPATCANRGSSCRKRSRRVPERPESGVVDIGLASTDLLYFASGRMGLPGTHVHRFAQPGQVQRDEVLPGRRPTGRPRDTASPTSSGPQPRRSDSGEDLGVPRAGREETSLIEEYAAHVRAFLGSGDISPLKVVADTANGMGGLVVPKVFEGLPFRSASALRRARRHVPEPSSRPDTAREPGRV